MKSLYLMLILSAVLILSASLLSCGGTADVEDATPKPAEIKTETPHVSRAATSDNTGEFTLNDAIITLLAREPRDGAQVVTFVYYRPDLSVVRTYDVVKELDPRLSCTGGKPVPYNSWDDVKTISYAETRGEIFEIFYPEVSGDCTLNIDTAEGPVTIELGDAGKTYRYAEKVTPGMKVFMIPFPGYFPVLMDEFKSGRHPMITAEIEEGDIVFPTGEIESVEVEKENGVELLLFREIIIPAGDDGWVVDDDEMFEYAGYMEAIGD